MIDKPLVSAIITTHNRLELLKRAVKSVYDQTYDNIELIVVDDASDDGTKEWCESQEFSFIRIDESKGGNHARNEGIRASKGVYIAFLDDDDYWLPEKTVKQLSLIQEKHCEMVHSGRRLEIISGKGAVTYRDLLPSPKHWGDMSKKILLTICATTTTIFVNREALIDAGLFDENLRSWQEYELTIRLAQRQPFYFVNEPLAVYRIDNNDRNRLTNKYHSWKDAVKYIHLKHKNLYSRLSLWEKIGVKLLVVNDARGRAMSSGLMLKYAILSLFAPLSKFYGVANIIKEGDFKYLKSKFSK